MHDSHIVVSFIFTKKYTTQSRIFIKIYVLFLIIVSKISFNTCFKNMSVRLHGFNEKASSIILLLGLLYRWYSLTTQSYHHVVINKSGSIYEKSEVRRKHNKMLCIVLYIHVICVCVGELLFEVSDKYFRCVYSHTLLRVLSFSVSRAAKTLDTHTHTHTHTQTRLTPTPHLACVNGNADNLP